jgi:hypothetical protein
MHMQMKNGLPRRCSAVDHGAERLEPLLAGNPCRHQQKMAQQGLILSRGLCQLADGLARNHQHVHRRLGCHITESQAVLIGIHLITGDFAAQNAGKDRVLAHRGKGGGTSGALML